MRRQLLVLLLTVGLVCALAARRSQAGPGDEPLQNAPAQQMQQNVSQGSDQAEEADPALKAEPLRTPDGRQGWKLALPGGRPLATPAYAEGRLFVGGGFGSHEFYCVDAATGAPVWVYHTADDGPTAAVYQQGCVAFNTESCELEILTPRGKRLWKKWLGDPLMSMPAIDKGKVFMAYPDSRGDRRHYLACFHLETGQELWKQPLAGEIITAPVIAEGRVYLSTLEGILAAYDAGGGELLWSEKKNVTSSPAVWKGQCYYSQRDEEVSREGGREVRRQTEQLSTRSATVAGAEARALSETRQQADYLDYRKKAASAKEQQNQSLDAGVGFAAGKGDAKIAQAQANLGEASVYGVWSYQGSRPTAYEGRLYSAMGDSLKCVSLEGEKVVWSRDHAGQDKTDRTLTPPAVVNGKLFVGTSGGEVLALSAQTGETLWSVRLPGESVAFQPVVARGWLYVPTHSGSLYGIPTGDPGDDGWYMWGADAGHSGLTERTQVP